MLAILGGLGAAVAWAATTLTASRATRMIDSRSLLAGVMTVGLLVSAPIAAISGVPAGLNGHSTLWLAVSGGGNVVGLLFVYSALRIGKVGLVAPITSTEGAVAAVITVVAGDSITPGIGATLIAIVVGVILATLSPADLHTRRTDIRAIFLAAAAAICFGFTLYATGQVGNDLGVSWAILPPRVVGVAVIAIPLALAGRWQLTRAAAPWVIASGLCEVLGFASFAIGARHGLAISAVLASQFAAIAAVFGYVVFRERLARVQVIGVVTIVCGVTVLSALHG